MGAIVFLSTAEVLRIHRRVIRDFGGDPGLRDRGLLESAVAMPQAAFAGQWLHEDLPAMAAACLFHLCANHPFVDGNKRVAVTAAELFLLANGHRLVATDDELVDLTFGVASGVIAKREVLAFFARHVRVG